LFDKLKSLLPAKIISNKFIKNVVVLIGGTAGSQVLLLAISPILTRLYTPDEFGVLAIFASIISIVAVIGSFRYEMAIPLAKTESSASNLVIICLIVLSSITIISFLIIVLFQDQIALFIGLEEEKSHLWLLPIGVAFAGLYKVFRFWAIRSENFKSISKTKFKQVVTLALVQIFGFKFGPVALIIGHISGHGMGSSNLALPFFKKNVLRNISFKKIVNEAIRFKKYPLYSTWSSLFNTTSSQIPPLLFAILFSPAVAGFYTLAQKAIMAPLKALGDAVADVFYSNAASAMEKGKLSTTIETINKYLIKLSLPPILIIILTGSELFDLIFGDEWHMAGVYAQWLSSWLFMVFITSPLSRVFLVLEKQAQESIFQFGLLVARTSSIMIGYSTGDAKLTIILYSLVSTVSRGGILVYLLKISGVSLKKTLITILTVIKESLLFIIPIILVKILWPSHEFLILILVILSISYIAFKDYKMLKYKLKF
jgi:O-antigen/teichoic acid export membrane protein